MNIEDKFKKQLGDLAFSVTVLQHQLEEAQTKLDEYEKANEAKVKDVRSTKS
jgi:hypothetical protein